VAPTTSRLVPDKQHRVRTKFIIRHSGHAHWQLDCRRPGTRSADARYWACSSIAGHLAGGILVWFHPWCDGAREGGGAGGWTTTRVGPGSGVGDTVVRGPASVVVATGAGGHTSTGPLDAPAGASKPGGGGTAGIWAGIAAGTGVGAVIGCGAAVRADTVAGATDSEGMLGLGIGGLVGIAWAYTGAFAATLMSASYESGAVTAGRMSAGGTGVTVGTRGGVGGRVGSGAITGVPNSVWTDWITCGLAARTATTGGAVAITGSGADRGEAGSSPITLSPGMKPHGATTTIAGGTAGCGAGGAGANGSAGAMPGRGASATGLSHWRTPSAATTATAATHSQDATLVANDRWPAVRVDRGMPPPCAIRGRG
jgi:hypothetical protein